MDPVVGGVDGLAVVVLDVAELREQLAEIAETVAQLRESLEALTEGDRPGKYRAWCWPDLNAAEAQRAWIELTDWLRVVLLPRYPETVRVLFPCWYRHPSVLDSLTALYATWRAAYRSPKAPAVLAASWLDRWLPAALRQIRSGLQGCDPRSHAEGNLGDE